ncbi:MAG: hypothetical protein DMG57_22150 [Acidobacteria bacterium]|nr:MAG: hypothetical protein DMG57_22150 [Acidobacteriota bacterium]
MRILAAICGFLSAFGVALLCGQAAHDIRLCPDNITIWGAQSTQHFLVLGQQAGLERDVTSSARFSVSPAGIGEVDKSGVFTPKANGPATITAEFQGRIAKAGVRIEAFAKQRSFSFAHDIASIFTKRGCNNADCHGSVKGRGGFKLSMNAQFPRQDYTLSWKAGPSTCSLPTSSPRSRASISMSLKKVCC